MLHSDFLTYMPSLKGGLKSTSCKLGNNVFGRVDDYEDSIVPAFCRAALQGYPLRLEGGKNILDLTCVEDVTTGTSL